jgi:tetratricopeptide (TPR) repeat protein
MNKSLRCVEGHRWEVKLEELPRDYPAADLCPICGSAAETIPPHGPDQGNTVDTEPRDTPGAAPLPQVHGYAIVGVLGGGGMGIVYKAEQLTPQRPVALKMIRTGAAEGDLVRRFRTEAAAVAKLRHPGIVQIYEVSEHEGRPFFSMELVEAGSLERQLRQGPLPPALAARLVAQAAEAIHHAHGQQIIHRDLKPGNILLSRKADTPPPQSESTPKIADCEPKVTDFGLAKKLDEPGLTNPGEILGTPRYMAPEQVWGASRIRTVSPATDVWALGAILYECLTGRAPFQAPEVMDTFQQVLNEEPVPVRRLQPKVPRDLETICLKCLQKDPARRYASALGLAEDLRRFLAGEPIQARPVGWVERGLKWVKRQPAAAALVAVIVLAASCLLGLWAYFTASLAERNQKLFEEQGKTQQALTRSQTAEKSASKQRQLALKTVRRVVSHIHVRLKDVPNQQELRKELLAEALAGLKEVERAVDTAVADHVTIWALFELGDLYREIEIGGLVEGRRLYQQAHGLARSLAQAEPGSAQAERDLSVSLSKLGDVQLEQGDTKAALASYREALQVHRRLAQADPRSAEAQRDLAISLGKQGEVQVQQGDTKAALASFQESLQLFRKLAQADPGSARAQRAVSISLNKLGEVQWQQGDTKAALASYQESLQLCRRWAQAHPRSVWAQRELSFCLNKAGDVQLEQGDIKTALASYQESLRVRRRLAQADPRSAQTQRDLSVSLIKLGEVQWQQGDAKAALASYQESLQLCRRLAQADSRSVLAQRALTVSLQGLGDVQLEQGDTKAALASYREALQVCRRLAQADPRSARAQHDLLISCFKLGNHAQQSSDFRAAADWYGKALAIPRGRARPRVFQQEVGILEARLRFCRAAGQAIDDLASLDKQPAKDRLELLPVVNQALIKRKEFTKAVQAAEKLAGLATKAGDLYNAACAFALCVPLADKDQDKLSARAMELLRQAVAKGYKNAAHMKKDADLNALRQRDDFQKLLAELDQPRPD